MRSLLFAFTGACLLALAVPQRAGSQVDPFSLRAAKGPYKTSEAAGHHIPANSPRKPEAAVFQSQTGGFLEALVLGYPGGIGTDSYLGLRTERGWFYVEIGYTKLTRQTAEQVTCAPLKPPSQNIGTLRCTVSRSASTPLPGRGCDTAAETFKQELAFLCAVGPSGVPACTQPISVAEQRAELDCKNKRTVKVDWQLATSWSSDGITVTEVAVRRLGLDDAPRALLGQHAVRLPE